MCLRGKAQYVSSSMALCKPSTVAVLFHLLADISISVCVIRLIASPSAAAYVRFLLVGLSYIAATLFTAHATKAFSHVPALMPVGILTLLLCLLARGDR